MMGTRYTKIAAYGPAGRLVMHNLSEREAHRQVRAFADGTATGRAHHPFNYYLRIEGEPMASGLDGRGYRIANTD